MSRKTIAAILCGGWGSRLRSVIGDDLPKCLAPVGGKPFLSYLLDQLSGQGVEEVVLCCGPYTEKFYDKFHSAHDGMKLLYSGDQVRQGTGGALRVAGPLLIGSDPVLVLNGDTVCSFSLKAMLAVHRLLDYDVTMAHIGRTATGAYLLSQRFLEALPKGPSSLEGRIDNWPSGKVQLYTASESLSFLDIGTPETYENAEVWLAARGMI